MSTRDKPGFKGARLGVESGVPDGGICLAGAGAHVDCCFKQHHLQAFAHQGAGNSAPDGAAPDYRDVKGLLHVDDYRAIG